MQVLIEFSYSGVCSARRGHNDDDDNDNVGWPGLIILLV